MVGFIKSKNRHLRQNGFFPEPCKDSQEAPVLCKYQRIMAFRAAAGASWALAAWTGEEKSFVHSPGRVTKGLGKVRARPLLQERSAEK